jgi:hypothetical protein
MNVSIAGEGSVEGHARDTGNVRGLSGTLAPASGQALASPAGRHETSHDHGGSRTPAAGIEPGLSPAVLAFSPGIQEVLDHVASTNGWRLVSYLGGVTLLRRRGERPGVLHCPISSYGAEGTTQDERLAILRAADGAQDHSPALREALLQAGRCA